MRTFPIFVSFDRRPPLVVGGGELAAIKARLLLKRAPSVDIAADRVVPELAELLRAERVATDMAYGDRKLGGAMKAADRSGAHTAVVIGDRDLAEQVAQVKDLASGEQRAVPLTSLIEELVR